MKKRHTYLAMLGMAAAMMAGCTKGTTAREATRTEALGQQAWQGAQWISVANAPVVTGRVNDHENGRSADGASWFVSTITTQQPIKRARWMTTALGTYLLYVNGQPVGHEVLKPGFTHTAKTRRSFTYDVTPCLQRKAGAQNRLAVQVTPGWWADKIVTPWGHDGMVGRKCAFRGVLELTFSDGSTRLLGTDTLLWRAAMAGPVTHAGIFDGEAYDARLALSDDMLSTPQVNTEFQGNILPNNGAEVYHRDDLALSPVRAYTWSNVEQATEGQTHGRVVIDREFASGEALTVEPGQTLVVDFGQNCAAVPDFIFKADEGTRLTCLPGELLNDSLGARSRGMDGPEGSVHRDNLRAAATHMRVDYTFAGGASAQAVHYRPMTTFFGYRYLSITATGRVTIEKLASIPVTSIAKEMETGTITTGNPLVNRLIQNTVWGQRSNYLSVPTDCPQRNERLGWTADTQVFTETGTFFANTDAFFHKWMRDMRDSQSPQGGFPGVAPQGQYGGEMMRLGWADAGIIVPWTVWKQFADTAIINENWQAMQRFMQHVSDTRYDHTALQAENGNYQWADWLSYEPLESCGGGAFRDRQPLPEAVTYWNYLGACYWLIDAEMMRDMAAATGRADANRYQLMADSARLYLQQQFLNADGTFRTPILNTMQTPALFALKNQLVQGAARDSMVSRLRQNFAQHNNCLQTGFLGTSILMSTLTDNGLSDLAYELLLQRRNPSWLYSIDQGATTIWERWNSYMADRGMGPRGMNSFNHYAYGCVCQWLWESAAGIAADPQQPGFRHIIMRPVPDKRLGHLEAQYQSAAGLIKSAWRYDGDRCTWQFTVPRGCTATVQLPGEVQTREYGAGSYTLTW